MALASVIAFGNYIMLAYTLTCFTCLRLAIVVLIGTWNTLRESVKTMRQEGVIR